MKRPGDADREVSQEVEPDFTHRSLTNKKRNKILGGGRGQPRVVHHNPYESNPNTVVINASKSSTEIPSSGNYIVEGNSTYEMDLITHMQDGGSFGGGERSYERSRASD